ncbi:MAG: hypothetical protein K6A94_01015 [Bacteroidales bacterium]|nr:hypothetical protein [Bacteroidales bacterium]
MKKIMFNNTYGFTQAVKQGTKTMTRRVLNLTEADEEYLGQAFDWDLRESVILDRYAQYKVGEIVAVAESYKDIIGDRVFFVSYETGVSVHRSILEREKGWSNKQNVASEFMPTRIRITDRKIERLRSISVEDCLKEGVMIDPYTGLYFVPNLYLHRRTKNTTGPTLFEHSEFAYYSLCKKLRMILDTAANPWTVAYTFEHVEKGGAQ